MQLVDLVMVFPHPSIRIQFLCQEPGLIFLLISLSPLITASLQPSALALIDSAPVLSLPVLSSCVLCFIPVLCLVILLPAYVDAVMESRIESAGLGQHLSHSTCLLPGLLLASPKTYADVRFHLSSCPALCPTSMAGEWQTAYASFLLINYLHLPLFAFVGLL